MIVKKKYLNKKFNKKTIIRRKTKLPTKGNKANKKKSTRVKLSLCKMTHRENLMPT